MKEIFKDVRVVKITTKTLLGKKIINGGFNYKHSRMKGKKDCINDKLKELNNEK